METAITITGHFIPSGKEKLIKQNWKIQIIKQKPKIDKNPLLLPMLIIFTSFITKINTFWPSQHIIKMTKYKLKTVKIFTTHIMIRNYSTNQ